MLSTVVPRIAVRKVVLAAPGKLSTGTITPVVGSETAGRIPDRIVAADVYNAAAWSFTDIAGGEVYPVDADVDTHMPGSFVRDTIFAAGTYKVCFYLDI